MSDGLIQPEATAAIGRTVEQRTGTVFKKEFQRWAAAVGDLNPLYFDEEVARAHGYRDVIMPPMFLGHVTSTFVLLSALRPDGTAERGTVDIPLPARRMAGGEETEFYAPIFAGDVVSSTRRLAGLQEKHGRSGDFVLVNWETTYLNQDEEQVAKTVNLVIAR
jgi:acyl dehydratase